MASLVLHNVPESLLERLEARAQQNKRSLEDEVLQVLDEVVTPPRTFMEAWRALKRVPEEEEPEQDPFEGIRDRAPGPKGPW